MIFYYLKILGEKTTFSKELMDEVFKDYEDVVLKVRCDGIPKPTLKWFKDGVEIKEDDRLSIKTTDGAPISSELSISHFKRSDEGRVSCFDRSINEYS
jgi:hypothetical protein